MEHLPPFLGLDPQASGRVPARVSVLPVPFEETVSYEGGTAAGPHALLTASAQVELYDRALRAEPYRSYGVVTLAPFESSDPDAESFVSSLARHVDALFDEERIIAGLGGEHTITVGLVRGTARALGHPVTLVQIDAHADLRDEYESNRYSHACVARRLLEDGADRIVQIGVRSVCSEEAGIIERDERIVVHWADDVHGDRDKHYLGRLAADVRGRDVYLTIDVDGLDPGLIAATGTPEPGGMSWMQFIDAIDTVVEASRIVGFDVVELAPRPGLHASDFAAAKLAYLVMNRIARARDWL
jgi:agmatinase